MVGVGGITVGGGAVGGGAVGTITGGAVAGGGAVGGAWVGVTVATVGVEGRPGVCVCAAVVPDAVVEVEDEVPGDVLTGFVDGT